MPTTPTHSADIIYQNLRMQANVVEAAFQIGAQKLLLGGELRLPQAGAAARHANALGR
jgi:hypothetical protein